MKRALTLIIIVLFSAMMAGCWNYRSLDEIDIVTGVAVDKDEESGEYLLTFEIVDTQSGSENGVSALYIDSKGETIFDAIRNSKKKLINKLYGGNMQALIISRKIAESEGVSVIMEEFLRDGEPRETMSVAISQEETAKEILLTEGIDSHIIAYEIHDMIQEDSKVTAATVNTPLYKAYNAVKGLGNVLALPAVKCGENNEETVAEGNGVALFSGSHLKGFLPASKTMYYLMAVNELKGGVISFPIEDKGESISMEVKESQTKVGVTYKEGKIFINLSIKNQLNIMELKSQVKISQYHEREKLERTTEAFLKEKLAGFFEEIQQKEKRDIFGMGQYLYRKEPDLWRSIKKEWDTLFQTAEIKIKVSANIKSAGVLKEY